MKLLKIDWPSFVGDEVISIFPRSCGKTKFRMKIMFLNYLIHKYKDIIYIIDTDAAYFIADMPESNALMRDIQEFNKLVEVRVCFFSVA